jgi:parallel beta-helix repeat protein
MRLQIGCVAGAGPLFGALRGAVVCGLLAADFAGAATFTVTNTNDSGTGSLREALVSANGNGNPGAVDTIAFNIAGSGVHRIGVTSGLLPDLVEPVFIDGLSQPGASCSSWPPTLQIEVRTELHAFWTLNLVPGSDGSSIRGIVFNVGAGPVNSGIRFTSDRNKVQCNFVGTNAAGDAALPFGVGVDLTSGADMNVIGTDGDGVNDDRERNLVSGNSTWQLDLQFAHFNVIAGNTIGTNAAGTAALGANVGVLIAGGAMNNRIGTNGDGVSDTLERNVISGNKLGVKLYGGATGNTLAGNFIGTNAGGTSAVPNTGAGLDITGTTTIGGAGVRANRIAFNGTWGVVVRDPSTSVNIVSNSIYSNGDRGIDLGGDSVTANDTKDTDAGPNQLQNYPVLTGAFLSGGTLSVSGALNSAPSTTFLVQIFANDACDSIGGFGEGQIFLGSITVTTNGDGDATFSDTYAGVSAGQKITATARDPGLNSSEFSACLEVVNATPTGTPTHTGTPPTTTPTPRKQSLLSRPRRARCRPPPGPRLQPPRTRRLQSPPASRWSSRRLTRKSRSTRSALSAQAPTSSASCPTTRSGLRLSSPGARSHA